MRSKTIGNEPIEPEFISTEDAARLTGMSVAWFERSRVFGGGPPFVKINRSVKYPVAELRRFMRVRMRTSSTDVPRVRREIV